MVKFLIYLFESSLCLAVMSMVYYFFLKKETYFGFNRIYLNVLVAVILVIPVLHISISVPDTDRLESPVSQIFKLRSYYEQVIAMTDAEYGVRLREEPAGTDLFEGPVPAGMQGEGSGIEEGTGESSRQDRSAAGNGKRWMAVHLSDVLLVLYLLGASFFIVRFLILIFWLVRLARKYGVKRVHGVKLICFFEDISPFSFFRYVFMNREAVSTDDYRAILAHEQVHIRQRHSLDLMVIQGITVIQWFNPFAWLVRDAIKSTHEYIADQQVISQGFGLHDYQSLLLKQLITSRPVELVNNFNLKPIKTRIAMMTKIRSGFPAKLKALLVIPVAFALFLLFADMSFRGPENTVFNFSSYLEERQYESDLNGLWQNEDESGYGPLIHFEAGKLQILEEPSNVLTYSVDMTDEYLSLSRSGRPPGESGINMKYKLEGEQLSIWWSDAEMGSYNRTGQDNSMDMVLAGINMKIDLPVLGYYRILEDQELVYKICLGYPDGKSKDKPVLNFSGELITIDQIASQLEKEKSKHRKTDLPYLTAALYIDKEVPMEYVHEIKQELRENNALKFAAAGMPKDNSVSPVLRHTVGMPRLLPPMDAQLLDKEEVKKHGLAIFEMKLLSPADMAQKLHDFIGTEEKYIIELVYDDEIQYGYYIEAVDLVFKVIIDYRNKLAQSKYNTDYLELPASMQKEIKKRYPVTLTERNADE